MNEADQVATQAWIRGRAENIGRETARYWKSTRGMPDDLRRELTKNFNEELLMAEFGMHLPPGITLEVDE